MQARASEKPTKERADNKDASPTTTAAAGPSTQRRNLIALEVIDAPDPPRIAGSSTHIYLDASVSTHISSHRSGRVSSLLKHIYFESTSLNALYIVSKHIYYYYPRLFASLSTHIYLDASVSSPYYGAVDASDAPASMVNAEKVFPLTLLAAGLIHAHLVSFAHARAHAQARYNPIHTHYAADFPIFFQEPRALDFFPFLLSLISRNDSTLAGFDLGPNRMVRILRLARAKLSANTC